MINTKYKVQSKRKEISYRILSPEKSSGNLHPVTMKVTGKIGKLSYPHKASLPFLRFAGISQQNYHKHCARNGKMEGKDCFI